MSTLASELRAALRALRQRPAFTVTAALTLALGIGASAAVFTVVDAVLLRPLPYPAAERLVSVLAAKPRRGPEALSVTPADFLAWRERSQSFSELGAYVPFGTVDLLDQGDPVRLRRHLVSNGLLGALGVVAERGRLFSTEEYEASSGGVVLLSHALWVSRFAAAPDAVGRQILLSGKRYLVAGVLPATLHLPGGAPDLLLPLRWKAGDSTDRSSAYLGAIGRLRPDTTLAGARAEMGAITADLARQFPDTNSGLEASVVELGDFFARDARVAIWLLFGAVGFVLLLSCLNVAGLHVMRSAARESEIALRYALGAGRGDIARQILIESAMLAVLGGGLGLLLAVAALRVLPDPRGVYLAEQVGFGIDASVVAFTLALSALSAAVSGVLPALRVSRVAPALSLSGRGATGRREQERLLARLVTAEVAVAFVLLVGSGLLMRSLVRLLEEPPGFRPGGVLTFDVALPEAAYPGAAQVAGFYRELLDRVAASPGVVKVAAAKEIPPVPPWGFKPRLDGDAAASEDSAGWQVVSEDYFATFETRVLGGRPFSRADRDNSPRVALVNESAARRFSPGRSPLGRAVRFNGASYEIVGVVGDQRNPSQSVAPQPLFYFPLAQNPVPPDLVRSLSLALRTESDPMLLANRVREIVRGLDPNLPVSNLETLEHRLAGATVLGQARFNATLLSWFAALALAIAAVGTYAVLSYAVSRRVRELGVRAALGANRLDLVRLVLGRGLSVSGLGVVLGACGALFASSVLRGLLFRVSNTDAATYTAVGAVLMIVSLAACLVPALRASRLDPVEVLRHE